MNTEQTDNTGLPPVQGWVGYDDGCRVCAASVRRWHGVFDRRGFVFVPLRNAWQRERLGLRDEEIPGEMKLLLADGRVAGGAEALVEMGRTVWWLWPLAEFASLPGIRGVVVALYRTFAVRRHCIVARKATGAARDHGHHRHGAFLELP